jgi:O-antigen/teichoic acid export membrane protein
LTRTGRFLRGLSVGYTSQVLTTLVGLWLTTFLLGRLGQVDYGLWLVATQVLSYLLLLDLGIVALLPRETAFATGRAGSSELADDLPDIVAETTTVVLMQLPLVAAATAAVWFFLPVDWEGLRGPLGWVMLAFVLGFPLRILRGVLEGLQDLAFVGIINTASWFAGTAVTVGLVYGGLGLYALAVGWIATQGVSGIAWWLRLRGRFKGVLPGGPARMPWPNVRRRLAGGLWISMQQTAQVLLQGTDLIIVGRILGPAAVVPYFVTAKLLTVLSNQPLMLIQTAGPGLSELRTAESPARLHQVSTALTQATLIISGGIVCVVLAINEGFVSWWVGPEQFGGLTLTVLLLAAMLLRHWNTTVLYTVFAFGHDRRISLTTLADGILTVAVSIVLVGKIGPIGAAIGSIVGVCLVSLPANVTALARDTHVSLPAYLGGLWPWIWRFTLPCGVAAFIARGSILNTLPLVATGAVIIGAGYTLLMLRLALRDPLGIYVRPRLDAFKIRLSGSTGANPTDTAP